MTQLDNSSSARRSLPSSLQHKHIVDQLIEERAPRLARSVFWPAVSPVLKSLLHYGAARRMADAIRSCSGTEAFDHVSALMHLRAVAEGTEHVPPRGSCMIVSNHPTGIADGIAMYNVLSPIRSDISFFANADALRVSPGLSEVIIPVVWPARKRTLQSSRATLRVARKAFQQHRAVVVFPAGALARRIDGLVQDPPWEHSAVGLARRHGIPIIPAHMAGPFPFWFHSLGRISHELRDVTLFHELLNKAGQTYRIRFGRPLEAGTFEESDEALTRRLKTFVETTLPSDPHAPFA